MIQRAGGTLNEPIAEGLVRPTSRWFISTSGLTAGTTRLEHAGPTVVHTRKGHWLLDPNIAIDAFAGRRSYAAGSYTHESTVRQVFELDIVTIEGPSTLLGQTKPYSPTLTRGMATNVSILGTSGALSNGPESKLAPYLALVRSLLERDQVEAVRNVLDAAPLDILSEPEMGRLRRLLAPPRIIVSQIRDTDRTREYRWLRNAPQEYQGQWVALEGDRVVAAARSLKDLRDRLRSLRPVRPPLIHRVP